MAPLPITAGSVAAALGADMEDPAAFAVVASAGTVLVVVGIGTPDVKGTVVAELAPENALAGVVPFSCPGTTVEFPGFRTLQAAKLVSACHSRR